MVRLSAHSGTQLYKTQREIQIARRPSREIEHFVAWRWQRWLEKLKVKFPALLIQDATSQHIGLWAQPS